MYCICICICFDNVYVLFVSHNTHRTCSAFVFAFAFVSTTFVYCVYHIILTVRVLFFFFFRQGDDEKLDAADPDNNSSRVGGLGMHDNPMYAANPTH